MAGSGWAIRCAATRWNPVESAESHVPFARAGARCRRVCDEPSQKRDQQSAKQQKPGQMRTIRSATRQTAEQAPSESQTSRVRRTNKHRDDSKTHSISNPNIRIRFMISCNAAMRQWCHAMRYHMPNALTTRVASELQVLSRQPNKPPAQRIGKQLLIAKNFVGGSKSPRIQIESDQTSRQQHNHATGHGNGATCLHCSVASKYKCRDIQIGRRVSSETQITLELPKTMCNFNCAAEGITPDSLAYTC